MKELFDKIVKSIHEADCIAIFSHTSPDPDALGSSCALALALKKLGKQVECINESEIDTRANFYPKY